ncbi:ammonium transporter [Xylophilus ampelinus]|uniref:Ammonium transporter n=1 Tax=Xylophilus ampelinus TaxID=54067 RepID=A0A318SF12_9BURK|nr:ammonium transporter [Xylophilus ampelinus]MCS4511138.1 ammonium transporter [Xylophilus ampelinus]PYE75109.1 ammonium transporter [Xylophilus ampelinus]
MKKLLASLLLGMSLLAGGSFAVAQTAATPTAEAAAPASPAPAAAAPAAAAPAAVVAAPAATPAAPAPAPAPAPAAAGPVPNKGDTGWMMVCTLLVLMMAVPGLALFYGGLVRSKNMLSVLMQVMVTFSLIVVLWFIYGYSLAFTEGNAFIGGFDRFFMKGIWDNTAGTFANGATFSKGVAIPEIVFAAFQATFAGITCALIVGSFAERIKFSAVLVFMAIWFTFSYLPMAHMVWFWQGPDAYTGKEVVDSLNAKAGLIWQWGALDFAGGTVVHINAAVAGLVGAFVVGKRIGYGKEALTPHSLTLTMVGAALLWVGWFGFNAGSALEANGTAALAFVNTMLATAAAVLTWCLGEAMLRGKASMLGAASGAVAGLVAITPAAGNVGIGGGLVIGLLAGFAGLWGVTGLKKMLGADDSLDVFGVHGVCGILGAILTGVFNAPALGGPGYVADWVTATVITSADYSIASQVWAQLKGVLVTVVWSGVVSFIAFKVVDLTIGLRVSEESEREGLDITSHGETAYNR